MQHTHPFSHSPTYRDPNQTYVSTYGRSYRKLPTYEVSPVYREKRTHHDAQARGFPYDLSPYPAARDDSPIRLKLPYQPMSYYEEEEFERQQREREHRSRFEDSTLRRDEYMGPLPENRYADEELEYQSPRGRPRERFSPRPEANIDKAELLRAQFDDLVADGQPTDPHDLKPAFCHNTECFEDKRCMNRLGCGHQFCDACMANMPGSDGPFRDTIRWHYCCKICRKWTSEPKLVRTDPYGRRLMRFHDIGYFKTS